jgi:hypothetical protein
LYDHLKIVKNHKFLAYVQAFCGLEITHHEDDYSSACYEFESEYGDDEERMIVTYIDDEEETFDTSEIPSKFKKPVIGCKIVQVNDEVNVAAQVIIDYLTQKSAEDKQAFDDYHSRLLSQSETYITNLNKSYDLCEKNVFILVLNGRYYKDTKPEELQGIDALIYNEFKDKSKMTVMIGRMDSRSYELPAEVCSIRENGDFIDSYFRTGCSYGNNAVLMTSNVSIHFNDENGYDPSFQNYNAYLVVVKN